MLNQLAEGTLRFETCGKPKHLRVMIDETIPGCSFIVKTNPVPLMKTFPVVFPDGTIPIHVTLSEAFIDSDNYWLLCFVFGCKDFYAWVLQSQATEAELIEHGNTIFNQALRIATNPSWNGDNAKIEVQEIMGLYLEEHIPGIRVLEYGELPNGIMASFLVTNPNEILDLFLEDKLVKNVVAIGSEIIEVEAQPRKQRAKPVNAKMKVKQEKRQKNWSQAKKGKADS